MHSRLLPLLSSALVLFLAASRCLAAEITGWEAGLPAQATITEAVTAKVPAHLEVLTIAIQKHAKAPNPAVEVWHIETAVTLRAKVPLFDAESGPGGALFLREKTAAQTERSVAAKVVLVFAPSKKPQLAASFLPPLDSAFGKPRSIFTGDSVIVRGTPEEAAWLASRAGTSGASPTAAASTGPFPAATAPLSPIETRLRALVAVNGVIHGEDPDVRPVLPFTLREVTFEAGGVVKATFTRITTHAMFPVVGQIRSNQIEFTGEPAFREAWRNPSRPPLFLLTADESALTSGTRQVAIPLDTDANRALGARHQRMVTPWETLARAAAFILADGALWDLDAKARVAGDWSPHSGSVRLVKDAPGLFWKVASEWGVALPVGGMTDWGMGTLRPRGDQYAPAFLRDGSGWVAADGVRVVMLEAGDFWRAEYDWSTGEFRHREQVTSVGVFDGAKPLAWYGAHFFVERPEGGAKPVVRIDLGTGDLVEMAKPYAFDGAANTSAGRVNGSPDGRYLAKQHPEGMIFLYDLVREEEFRLDGAHTAKLYGKDTRVLDWPRMWASERVFLGAYGWYDVANRTRRLVSSLAQTQGFESLDPMQTLVLPGGAFIDTVLVAVPIHPMPKIEERFRIDLRSGDMVRLPDFHEFSLASSMPAWIDEDRYLYVRDKGGLAEIGVWLYDVRTRTEKRLSALLPDSQAENDARAWSDRMNHRRAASSFLLLPERNQIVYVAKRGSQRDLLLVSLADGKTEVLEKATTATRLARVVAEPVDLDIARVWTGIWNHASYGEVERAAERQSDAGTLTAEERFLRDLTEIDPARRQRLIAIFGIYHDTIGRSAHHDFWDPVKLAHEALLAIEQDAALKRAALAAEADERTRAVLQVELQRLERGDFHANDVTTLMVQPEFNRRTYDREKIHAALQREAANAWVSSPETPGTKEEFARYYADRLTDRIMEQGRLSQEANVPLILAEWKKLHRLPAAQP